MDSEATWTPTMAELAAATVTTGKTVVAGSVGPAVITLLGYDVPLLSALFGVLGVILSRRLAPPSSNPLAKGHEVALTAILCLIIVAVVIYDQKSPLITLGWAIGLGFSGITIIETLGRRVTASSATLVPDTAPEFEKSK